MSTELLPIQSQHTAPTQYSTHRSRKTFDWRTGARKAARLPKTSGMNATKSREKGAADSFSVSPRRRFQLCSVINIQLLVHGHEIRYMKLNHIFRRVVSSPDHGMSLCTFVPPPTGSDV